jgi:hypothetical protein
MMKGTIVRWEDVMAVQGAKVVAVRNQIMALPARFADKWSREEVEELRKWLYQLLMDIGNMKFDDVQVKNERMKRYTKASTKVDSDDLREQGKGTAISTAKSLNKPV